MDGCFLHVIQYSLTEEDYTLATVQKILTVGKTMDLFHF